MKFYFGLAVLTLAVLLGTMYAAQAITLGEPDPRQFDAAWRHHSIPAYIETCKEIGRVECRQSAREWAAE